MIGYPSTLLGRTEVAEGTLAFQFEKPKGFVFEPGRHIDLTLLSPGSSTGMIHTFSIALSVRRRDPSHDPHTNYSFQAGLIHPANRQRSEDRGTDGLF